jgi:glycoprotease/Kae1 family metallohydrolase
VRVLGIETSCDETGVAVVEDGRILSNLIASQIDRHARFGGVVPEVASRAHVEALNPIVEEALERAGCRFGDLDGVAVTFGPGLVGALLVGIAGAKAIAFAQGIPLVGVNHLEGHVYANFLEHRAPDPPYVCLIVSGGHTMLVHMPQEHRYRVLGQTVDDPVRHMDHVRPHEVDRALLERQALDFSLPMLPRPTCPLAGQPGQISRLGASLGRAAAVHDGEMIGGVARSS